MTKPLWEQRWGSNRPKLKHWCTIHNHRHPSMHDDNKNTGYNTRWWIPARATKLYQKWMACNQDTDETCHMPIQDILGYLSRNQWGNAKRWRIIIPECLKQQALEQLDSGHMGVKTTCLLVFGSLYWLNINEDIGDAIKNCLTYLKFQQM